MKRNYQGVTERIKTVALAHPQVNSADIGRELEFDTKKNNVWPRFFVRVEDAPIVGGQGSVELRVNLTFLIMDRLKADRSNVEDVMNQNHSILTDILATLHKDRIVRAEDGFALSPLYDYQDTQTAGWQCPVRVYLETGFQCYEVDEEPVTGPTYYVRPSGGSYGTEDGTSYANAWDGFGNIDWSLLTKGSTLYICGTHTEGLSVLNQFGTAVNPVNIRGDYAADPGFLDGENTRDLCIDFNSRDYVAIHGLTCFDALVSCFNFRGTSKGITTFDCVAYGSGNQGFQHLDTAQVDHTRLTSRDNVDDGVSCHDATVVTVNGATITGNDQGMNIVSESNLTVSGDLEFANNTTYDLFVTAAASRGSAVMSVTGGKFDQDVRVEGDGKMILNGCTLAELTVALVGADDGILEMTNCIINGAIYDENAYVTDAGCIYNTSLFTSYTYLKTTGSVFNVDVAPPSDRQTIAENCLFLGLFDTQIRHDGQFVGCLITSVDPALYGDCTFTRCRISGNFKVYETTTFEFCLFDSVGAVDHVVDTAPGTDVTFAYCTFRDIPAAKFAIAFRTGAVGSVYGCSFLGAANVGRGIYTQVDLTVDNSIFYDLDTGVNVSGTHTVVVNNPCFFSNGTDTVGTLTINNEQTTDPVFLDLANNDFRLGAGSSCRGTGLDLGTGKEQGVVVAKWGDRTVKPVVTLGDQQTNWNIGTIV